MPAIPLTPAEIAELRSDMKAADTELREAYAAESESGDATCACGQEHGWVCPQNPAKEGK